MEIKRQIIESATPPSNKNVWWYDPSEGKIMRYTSGSWKGITDAPEKPFKAPITASTPTGIDIYIYDYDVEDFKSLEGESVTFNSDLQCNVLNIFDTTILDESISDQILTMLIDNYGDPAEWYYSIVLVFPESITEVRDFNISNLYYSAIACVFGAKLSKIHSAHDLFLEGWYGSMYFQSLTPPIMGYVDEYYGSCYIFVPEKALEAYTAATNWGIIIEDNSLVKTTDETLTVQEIINKLG